MAAKPDLDGTARDPQPDARDGSDRIDSFVVLDDLPSEEDRRLLLTPEVVDLLDRSEDVEVLSCL